MVAAYLLFSSKQEFVPDCTISPTDSTRRKTHSSLALATKSTTPKRASTSVQAHSSLL